MNMEPQNTANRVRGRVRAAAEAEPIRDVMREEARSTTNVAEGRTRKRKGEIDQFYIPPEIIPDGWVYQWCRASTLGEPDVNNILQYRENGWTPVPNERHEGRFMPPGHRGDITRGGLLLMERPRSLSDEARAEDQERSRQLIQAQKEQLGLAMPSGFRGQAPRVNQSYEPGVPQARHNLAVD